MTTTRKPFTTISPGILDTIACSVWPNENTKELKPPTKPFAFEEDEPLVFGDNARAKTLDLSRAVAKRDEKARERVREHGHVRMGILKTLANCPSGQMTSPQIAAALGVSVRSAACRAQDAKNAGDIAIVGRTKGTTGGLALFALTGRGRELLDVPAVAERAA